jgi:hypothetical protein
MNSYVWVNGARLQADANAVGTRLETLVSAGRVTPRMVVDDARPADSPLHQCFEWDDTRAAELHRESQARYVLRSIRVVSDEGTDTEQPRTMHAFVSVTETVGTDEQRAYVPIARVLNESDLSRQMCEQALRELQAFERRYAQFNELRDIAHEAIDRVQALLPIEQALPAA